MFSEASLIQKRGKQERLRSQGGVCGGGRTLIKTQEQFKSTEKKELYFCDKWARAQHWPEPRMCSGEWHRAGPPPGHGVSKHPLAHSSTPIQPPLKYKESQVQLPLSTTLTWNQTHYFQRGSWKILPRSLLSLSPTHPSPALHAHTSHLVPSPVNNSGGLNCFCPSGKEHV